MDYAYIREFGDIGAGDLAEAGGKGANLGELSRAGFPVPPGFAVLTDAFEQFMKDCKGGGELLEELEGVRELGRVRILAADLRSELEQHPFPLSVADEIRDFLKGEEDALYAVRSSATAEDLPGASFAGQQDTFLSVRGMDEILEHIKKCWISLFSDRACIYRAEKGFSHGDVKLSALVQAMVFSEASGIMFTADPASGHRGRLTIDAGFGLGEALVSGLVNPDFYQVGKSDFSLLDCHVGDKTLQIRTDERGAGTVREKLSGEMRKKRVLGDCQIAELARLGCAIEDLFGSPQDIEWALADGQFYILQSRPVTTLYPVPGHRDDGDLHVFISLGHIQVMTEVLSPMAQSVIRLFLPFGKEGLPGEYNPYVSDAGGRLYIDFSSLLNHPVFRRILPARIALADPLIGRALSELVDRDDFPNSRGRPKNRFHGGKRIKYGLSLVFQTWKNYHFLSSQGCSQELFRRFSDHIESQRGKIAAPGDQKARLLAARSGIETLLEHMSAVFSHFIPAFMAEREMRKMLRSRGDAASVEDDLRALQRGLTGNMTTQMDLELGDLADYVARDRVLEKTLGAGGDLKQSLDELRARDESAVFFRVWDRFLDLYGFRGVSEFDISRPRWSDDPSSVFTQVLGIVYEGAAGEHRRHYKQLQERAADAERSLCALVETGIGGRLRRRKMERLIRLYRDLLPLREHGKYFFMKLLGIVRDELIRTAGVLVREGRISCIEDIWFLDYNELINALDNRNARPMVHIERRRIEQKAFGDLKPPRVITSEGEVLRPALRGDSPPGALVGTGVSGGTAEGRARVILNPHKETLKKGEILVAPFTDPAWTPLFINAAAVVIEVGGLMTHGSVIAREYGIPAVVSLDGATEKIKSGQVIRVNGDEGYVEITS